MTSENEKVKKKKKHNCNHCLKPLEFETRELKKAWQDKNSICPHCGVEYCDKPPTELELMRLQEIFIENRISNKKISNEALVKLCEIIRSYSEALLHKKFKRATRDKEEMEGYMDGIVLEMLAIYLSRPDFKVDGSFWGYLWNIARGVLYGQKQMTLDKQAQLQGYNLVSMDQEIESSDYSKNSTLQIADTKADDLKNDTIDLYESVILYKKLMNLLKETSERIDNPYVDLLRLKAVSSIIKNQGNESILNIFTNVHVKDRAKKTMSAIRELIESCADEDTLWSMRTKLDKKDFGWIEREKAESICQSHLGENYLNLIDFEKLSFPILDTEIRDKCLVVLEEQKKKSDWIEIEEDIDEVSEIVTA